MGKVGISVDPGFLIENNVYVFKAENGRAVGGRGEDFLALPE